MSEIKDEKKKENENWGRTLMLTPKEENIQEILLKFMEDKGEGGCPAFSPDFMLRNLKDNFNAKNLIVGPKTLEKVLLKSSALHFDSEVTGTVSKYQNKATVTYTFSPNSSDDIIIAKIGGKEISKGEHTIENVGLTVFYKLQIQLEYAGIVDWKLVITAIEADGIPLKLLNFDEGNIKVSNNSTIKVRDKSVVNRFLNTLEI